MRDVDELVRVTGLVAPRNGVGNLVFFRVRGDCLAPEVRNGDVLFATWKPSPVSQAALSPGELAVFLVRMPGLGEACAVLKRWNGRLAGGNGGGEAEISLSSDGGEHRFPASQIHLLADNVVLAQRGWTCHPDLLAGTVYAGLDLWFADDVTRILASTHETMAASMRAAAPLNTETAEAYRKGFVDALRSVAIAFGVGMPSAGGRGTQTVVQVEVPRDGFRTLDAGKWG